MRRLGWAASQDRGFQIVGLQRAPALPSVHGIVDLLHRHNAQGHTLPELFNDHAFAISSKSPSNNQSTHPNNRLPRVRLLFPCQDDHQDTPNMLCQKDRVLDGPPSSTSTLTNATYERVVHTHACQQFVASASNILGISRKGMPLLNLLRDKTPSCKHQPT